LLEKETFVLYTVYVSAEFNGSTESLERCRNTLHEYVTVYLTHQYVHS